MGTDQQDQKGKIMSNIARRGFLKVGAAILGGLAITRYSEPIIQIVEKNEWIEDKGDYVIIRVPDFKTFANETIAKPAIFIMGQAATVKAIEVAGFANVYAPKGGLIMDSRFDASRMKTEEDRPVINLKAEGIKIAGCCHLIGNGGPGFGFTAYEGPMKTVLLQDFKGDIKGRQVLDAHGTTKGQL
jgi:hypothetical protein